MGHTPQPKLLVPLFGLAPGGVYLAAHVAVSAVRSYRTISPLPTRDEHEVGGIFSVALSVDLHPPGVTWHPAQWSPDFPPPGHEPESDCLANSQPFSIREIRPEPQSRQGVRFSQHLQNHPSDAKPISRPNL
jgi:hypothetical protein